VTKVLLGFGLLLMVVGALVLIYATVPMIS